MNWEELLKKHVEGAGKTNEELMRDAIPKRVYAPVFVKLSAKYQENVGDKLTDEDISNLFSLMASVILVGYYYRMQKEKEEN